MVLVAILVCAACSKDDVTVNQEQKYFTVGLGVTGEYLEISDTPLGTRATTTADTYGINVYTLADNGSMSLYASGCFTSLNDVKIKLLEGKEYAFKVGVCLDDNMYNFPVIEENSYTSDWFNCEVKNKFDYNGSREIALETSSYNYMKFEMDYFYGELTNYVPSDNKLVEIETKRVVYGAHFIAEGLTEGSLNINVQGVSHPSITGYYYSVTLTPEIVELDKIYRFYNIRNAWLSEDYRSSKIITISWAKDDGSETPIGSYEITFKRNIKTTIRIKLGESGLQNGIVITRGDTPMSGDDNEYVIEGGEIIEVPVTTE